MTITLTRNGEPVEVIEALGCRCSDAGVISMGRLKDNGYEAYDFRKLGATAWKELAINGEDWVIELNA